MTASRPFPTWLAATLIAIAGLIAFANSFDAPFVFDDAPAIVDNPTIRQLWPLGNVLRPPTIAGSAAGRPVANLSFALNYAGGGLDPRGYHAVNLALHVLAALVLFGVLRRTLLQPKFQNRYAETATILALAIAVLWTVHPLQTESVTCAVQRTEILGGLFLLLTLYAAIRADGAAKRWPWELLAITATLVGVACKELVATAPIIVAAYDYVFAAGSWRETGRRRSRLYLGLLCSWLVLLPLIALGGKRGGTAGFGLGVSSWEYLLTQGKAIVLYLKLSVWPHPLVIDYGTGVVKALGDVFWQTLSLVVLFIGSLAAFAKRRPIGFAGLCFFVILAPSSSVVPLISQTIAEHRMYLPLACVLAVIVLALHRWLGRRVLWLGGAVAIAFGALTVRRNQSYQSPLALWTDTVAHCPENPRARGHLAKALDRADRYDEALAEAREELRLDPNAAEAHYNLGYALLQTGRLNEAVASLQEALRRKPDYAEAHSNLSVALLKLGRVAEAEAELRETVRLNPDFAGARYNLANVLAQTGRLAEALPHYDAAVRLAPRQPDAHFNYGNALMESNRPAEAVAQYEAVLRLNPQDAEAARNLEMARQEAAARR